MSEWVKVSDKLPKKNEHVLFLVKLPEESWSGDPLQMNVGYYTDENLWALTGFYYMCCFEQPVDTKTFDRIIVTHWRKLPELPEFEENK